VVVDAEAVKQWEEGAMVEDAFPELDEDQHELLMTGYHPECWEKEFGDAV
jgi:hypothetical protein